MMAMRAGGKTGAGSELRGCSLEDVREREWQLIRSRREQVGLDPDGSGAGPSAVTGKDAGECGPDNAIDRNLVGLSLSGGGVRSGAVSLGFLMGLHSSKLLRWVDYLSTVSGGGYAGALYTAEMQRQSDGRQGIRGAMGVERFFAPDTDRASASGMSAGEVASKGV